jgi:hypothetical protein
MTSRTPRAHARIALAAVLGCAAAAAPAAAGGGAPGFAVSAVDFQSYFRYHVAPGRAARGTLRLISRSRRPVHVLLSGADVGTATNGGLSYGAGRPRDTGRWVRIRRRATIPPRRAIDVPFTVRVDRSARAGDHFAGIVAVNRRDQHRAEAASHRKGFSVRYLPRIAMTVQLTTPGAAHRALNAGGLSIDVTPSNTSVNLLLRNTGNRLLAHTSGTLTLSRRGRDLLVRHVDIGAFVPQTTIRYPLPLQGRPARGTYHVEGTLRPRGAAPLSISEDVKLGAPQSHELKVETGRSATGGTSIWLVIALAAAGLLVLILCLALLSVRRRLARARAVAP